MADDGIDLGIDDLTSAVQVGAGGFGTVYRAHQESLRRDVAVKMMANTVKDRKVRIRFEREIQAMGMLSGHPNIVTVYDSGFTHREQPYILMDYMEQGSLGDRLDREGRLPHTDVLDVMVKVCGALETAHQAGILHRDLKPENILVSGYGEPKLGDFGIARLKGGPETGTQSLTASIEHVAPELLEAAQPDVGSDLYALGSTMYKLLAGEAAFVRSGDDSIVPALGRIRTEPVPDLRQRGVPAEVAAVVERAMAKEPHDRFASAAEMGNALREAQRRLGLMPTTLPVRADEAAHARESTTTLDSDDIARSIEGVRATGPTGPAGPTGPWTSGPGTSGPGTSGPGTSGPVPATTSYGHAPRPPPPQHVVGGPPPPGPPPRRGMSPAGKLFAGLGIAVLIGAVGVGAYLVAGQGEAEDPPTEPEAPDEVAYEDYDRLFDDTGTITVQAPEEWDDVEGGPWVVDDTEVGFQIVASPDVEDFRGTWGEPGLIFGVSQQLADAFTPDELLDAIDFARSQCTYEGREPYEDAAYTGVRDDYVDCGGTDATYTIVASEPADGGAILLLEFQGVEDRDEEALERALDTFVIAPRDDE